MNKILPILLDTSQEAMNLGVSSFVKQIPRSYEINPGRKVAAASPSMVLITSTIQKFDVQPTMAVVIDATSIETAMRPLLWLLLSRRSPAGVWNRIITILETSESIPIWIVLHSLKTIKYTATNASMRFVSTKKLTARSAFFALELTEGGAFFEFVAPKLLLIFTILTVNERKYHYPWDLLWWFWE